MEKQPPITAGQGGAGTRRRRQRARWVVARRKQPIVMQGFCVWWAFFGFCAFFEGEVEVDDWSHQDRPMQTSQALKKKKGRREGKGGIKRGIKKNRRGKKLLQVRQWMGGKKGGREGVEEGERGRTGCEQQPTEDREPRQSKD